MTSEKPTSSRAPFGFGTPPPFMRRWMWSQLTNCNLQLFFAFSVEPKTARPNSAKMTIKKKNIHHLVSYSHLEPTSPSSIFTEHIFEPALKIKSELKITVSAWGSQLLSILTLLATCWMLHGSSIVSEKSTCRHLNICTTIRPFQIPQRLDPRLQGAPGCLSSFAYPVPLLLAALDEGVLQLLRQCTVSESLNCLRSFLLLFFTEQCRRWKQRREWTKTISYWKRRGRLPS